MLLDGYIASKSIYADANQRHSIELFVKSRIPAFRSFIVLRSRTASISIPGNQAASQCDRDWLARTQRMPISSFFDHRDKISFKGYYCTDDCSGHKAGYEWASRNLVNYADECESNNLSFTEGCWAWINEQY